MQEQLKLKIKDILWLKQINLKVDLKFECWTEIKCKRYQKISQIMFSLGVVNVFVMNILNDFKFISGIIQTYNYGVINRVIYIFQNFWWQNLNNQSIDTVLEVRPFCDFCKSSINHYVSRNITTLYIIHLYPFKTYPNIQESFKYSNTDD